MSEVTHDAVEIQRSYEVFTNPDTYKPFSLTKDFMRIVGCIDPRDEVDEGSLKVIIQTGGGAGGRGLDSALSLTATDADGRIYSIEEGLKYDCALERTTVAGGHNNHCKFLYGLGSIIAEMQEPSDLTRETVREFIARFGLTEVGVEHQAEIIRGAAECSAKMIRDADPRGLLRAIDSMYPYHPNVRDMRGGNRAGFYIVNMHPYVGLDRNLVHRGNDRPLTVQAYHDSPRAMVDALAGTLGMPRSVKEARLAALLLRTAATRTVICRGSEEMKMLNVVPKQQGGIEVQEVAA